MDQLKAMRTFVRVIDEGSFAAAARALEIAPAVATRTIADLEAHLGVRLMTRTTRSLALTDIGRSYLERARAILRDVDDAGALVSAAHAEPNGLVRVVAPAGFAVQQIGPRLARFHAAHPKVTVELTLHDRVEAPEDGQDISIVVTPAALDGDYVARRLARSELVACAQPALLERLGRPQRPEDLAKLPALVPGGRQWRTLTFVRRDGSESVTVTPAAPVLSTDANALNLAGALAGLGVTGVPSYLADADLRAGRLEQVLPDWRLADVSIWACLPSRKQVPASTRAFMDFLVAEFGGEDREAWPVARPPQREARDQRDQKPRWSVAIEASIAANGPSTRTAFWPRANTSRHGRASVGLPA
jgi:DNA-binding transcriptional LysR family regulator